MVDLFRFLFTVDGRMDKDLDDFLFGSKIIRKLTAYSFETTKSLTGLEKNMKKGISWRTF